MKALQYLARAKDRGPVLIAEIASNEGIPQKFLEAILLELKKEGFLESRKGKAPGGYNCPLAETGVPFIFMNAAGTMGDVITMMHEGGHAVHSFLSHPLQLSAFKEYPMEIAELGVIGSY